MTALHADGHRRRAMIIGVVAVALGCALGGPAMAQIDLRPQIDPRPMTDASPVAADDTFTDDTFTDDLPRGPIRLFPLPGAMDEADTGTEAAPVDAAPREVREGILAIDTLDAVSTEGAGLLDPGNGGLPLDMWQGSERAVIVAALRALPVSAPSRARQDLARRLLLSVAPPPAATSDAGPNLVDLRIDRLLAMGATADVRALIDVAASGRTGAEPLRRALAESWFIDNRPDDACAVVEDGLNRFDAIFWQKAAAYCSLVQGRPEAANLQLSLLREQGVRDEAFLWAAEQLAGLRVLSLNGVVAPSPLTIAMMRATGRPYPAGTLVDAAPWLLRAVALGEKTDMDTRLQTAEQAFQAGALSRAELIALYDLVNFPSAFLDRALDDIVTEPGARTNALLWQMAERQTIPAARAEVIAAALRAAEGRRQGLLGAHLYAPLIETLPPTQDYLWFAAGAARALYAAGRFDAGRGWFRMVAEAATTSAEAAAAADVVWPLDRLAFEASSGRWPARRLDAWRQAQAARPEPTVEPVERRLPRLEARLLSLFQATGQRVSTADWAPLFGRLGAVDGAIPPSPAWHAVTDATDSLRIGEAVLLSLMVLQEAAPGTASDAALFRAVESLRLVGLEDAARQIAVEGAVAAGL